MKLHQEPRLFQQAVRATAQRLAIPEIYVEKDYWVTLILKELFNSEIQQEIIKDFNELLENVKEDDRLSFKANTEWLDQPIGKALIFQKPKELWSALSPSFYGEFSKLLYGEVPTESEVSKTLNVLSKRISPLMF